MNAETIICIYFRHMQADISKFLLLPRLFYWIREYIGCINSLIAGALAPFLFSFPFIVLFIHWVRRLMAANAWRRANKLGKPSGEILFWEVKKIVGEKRWKLGFGIAYGEIKYI